MTRRRVCATCRRPVRATKGRWIHNERRAGTITARRLDADHRPVSTWAEPLGDLDHLADMAFGPLPEPPPAPRPARKPRRLIAPIPQPVRWGPPTPIERRPFDPDATRLRGCAAAAGVDIIGDL